jgi:flagellar hook-basal body complex protein FliE
MSIGSIGAAAASGGHPSAASAHTVPGAGASAFGRLVEDMLAGSSASSTEASQAIQSIATGNGENLHGIALSVARADLNFHLILELRNRFTEAYQDVMRMQI